MAQFFFTTTTPTEKKFWSENKIVLWTKNLQSVTFKPYLSTIRAFKTKQFISLFVKWVSTFVLCFSKVCLSHWSQVGNKHGLGALAALIVAWRPLYLLGHQNKCFMILWEPMNFHPDQQLFPRLEIKSLTLELKSPMLPPTPKGTSWFQSYLSKQ